MSLEKSEIKSLYYIQIIDHVESIKAQDLSHNIDEILLLKSKNSLGNKCSKDGFILKDSIRIIDRTIGKINSSHFTGDVNFKLKLEVKLCNPTEGDIIKCNVIGRNKMGILAKVYPLIIALSQLHHTDLDHFNSIKENDEIMVEVIDSKITLNEKDIQIIAKLYN